MQSLYERLGGSDGITKLVDDIVENHLTNPAVKARFLPLKDDQDHFAKTRQHLINFLASGTGGPEVYEGKEMIPAHRGMNISKAEYLDVIDDIMSALNKHNIDEQTQKDVLAIAYSLKDQIIGQ
ncbi:group 1 truncated hemoglobin [Mangrovibacterium marinum]|uniref:Hemoglobin n=1 Tax=Mangrovibacterium marinum TaxID=1639118 RepID=A0A2T5C0W1_9BACT|nr:group 1 truncated hemoglobin [Mangrovibacterium marinum]PTN08184.1 hemoglobin [Mangrovibacterium marinum]|eukprot:Anaeramoba_ignava/a93911_5.p1 GENE.a93911_5~~a93911_5.p1  ORF type:complete len:124 (+),score=4.05 a93911_5:201-572(+)